MKTLVVGDTTEYIAKYAQSLDRNAKLITESNSQIIISKYPNGVFWTSLGDFQNVETFCKVLLAADKIIYYPPWDGWSDGGSVVDKKFSMETETKEHLFQWAWIKKTSVVNLSFDVDHPDFSTVTTHHQRISDQQQVWAVGCSITAGSFLDHNNIYSSIVAKELGLPCSNLAYEGSGVRWASDQILISDIRKNDIVLWGVSSFNRYSYRLHTQRFYHVISNFYKNYPLTEQIVPIDWLYSPHMTYEATQSILAANNFCSKIGAKLVMLGVFPLSYYVYPDFLKEYSNFLLGPKNIIDLAPDNQHPGIKHHKKYADIILNWLKSN